MRLLIPPPPLGYPIVFKVLAIKVHTAVVAQNENENANSTFESTHEEIECYGRVGSDKWTVFLSLLLT